MFNKSKGNAFEHELCTTLYCHGAWVHNFAQNQAGQPADVIAVKNRHAWLIECKLCTGNRFNFNRIESNQHTSAKMWYEANNGDVVVAIKFAGSGKIYIVPFCSIPDHPVCSEQEIATFAYPFDVWMRMVGL